MDSKVAIDSNCLSYLVDAIHLGRKPTGNQADEKIALFRIYLYRRETLRVPPAVKSEYERIKDKQYKELHDSIHMILLEDVFLSCDPEVLESCVQEYSVVHPGRKERIDCQIVAEAELGGCHYLLTYDYDLLSHLKGRTHRIELMTPTKFWNVLEIPHGMNPPYVPHPTNPYSKQTWWIW